MSYFDARVGQGPAPSAREEQKRRETPSQGSRTSQPYFAAQIGAHRATPIAPPGRSAEDSAGESRAPGLCPLCRGPLKKENGLYHCRGRCGGRWLEESPGHLVDLAALPYGACGCCERPRALVKGDQGILCPVSGQAHLLLPDGAVPLARAAPHGLCQCCLPPVPLVTQDGNLVCRAKPANQYRLVGDRATLVATATATMTPAETLEAIDAALRRNNARVTINGLFDID